MPTDIRDLVRDVVLQASLEDVNDDALVAQPFPNPIPTELATRVARLALHMTLQASRNNVVIDPRGLRRWEERSPEERQRSRVTVIRVIQALQMLGIAKTG